MLFAFDDVLVAEWNRVKRMSVAISGGFFVDARPAGTRVFDGAGYAMFPGLINAHDHLPASWVPRVGTPPYPSVYAWLREQRQSDQRFERDAPPGPDDPFLAEWERRKLPMRDRYLLGAYKQVLSGVTTVADFVSNMVRERVVPSLPDLPVEVLADYRCEGGVEAVFNRGVVEELRSAPEGVPFFVHAAEGVDERAYEEVDRLDALGVLGPSTVIVHGVALTEGQRQRLARTRTSVCWCPQSQLYLYGQTTDVASLLQRGVNVVLGTDSSMTGSSGLLEDARVGIDALATAYGTSLEPETVLRMMTQNAANALGLASCKALVFDGYDADFVLLPWTGGEGPPAAALIGARSEDLALVVAQGRPVYGDTAFEPLFAASGVPYSRVLLRGVEKLLYGDPAALLARCWKAVGYEKPVSFLPLG